MNQSKREQQTAAWFALAFLGLYFLPLEWPPFQQALSEGLALTRWYAREHVILCLIPAFLIAGAIGTFVRQDSVLRYLGPQAPKPLAYGVASISGTVLAVCSCTVLPLFAGIWRMGAGIGPAVAFLYSGPAISALAIILTARVLGLELGLARAIGAIVFAVVIGWLMAWFFRREESDTSAKAMQFPDPRPAPRPLWQTTVWLGLMVAVLVFANWSEAEKAPGLLGQVAERKWLLTAAGALGMGIVMGGWFKVSWWKIGAGILLTTIAALWVPDHPVVAFVVGSTAIVSMAATTEGEMREWFEASWEFAKLIAPLLMVGVFLAGFLLGQPGKEGIVPSAWIRSAVGGNGLMAIFLSSLVGALMYFATLTEIPILQGLLANGMGKGPALALLLAGPALSLPNMVTLIKIMGVKKALLYFVLVVVMATFTGWIYGNIG
ncbi:MAG: permease [Candidatus Methylacidiphilales bacterium]